MIHPLVLAYQGEDMSLLVHPSVDIAVDQTEKLTARLFILITVTP